MKKFLTFGIAGYFLIFSGESRLLPEKYDTKALCVAAAMEQEKDGQESSWTSGRTNYRWACLADNKSAGDLL